MNIRRKKADDIAVNLTPLIDVVFLLVIFFMVTTTFQQTTQLGLELPEVGQHYAVADDESPIEIAIDAQGKYFLQGQRVSEAPSALKAQLKEALLEKEQPQLIIMGDKQAPYQAVIFAMDVAGQLGIKRVRVAANTQNVLHHTT